MKKKRKAGLVWGGICLAILILVYVSLINRRRENVEETTDTVESETMISLKQEDIVSMSYTLDGEMVEWKKAEGKWKLSGDEDFPTDNSKLDTIASIFTQLTFQRTLEDIENLKDYGLENPLNQMILMDGEKNEICISIGNMNTSTNCTYIYLNDDIDTIYTVTNDLISLLDGDLLDYALSEDYPTITSSSVYEMNVTKSKDSLFVYNDPDSSTGWSVKGTNGEVHDGDSMKISSLQSSLSTLEFTEYYDYDCKDLSVYGLDKPQMTIEVKYTQEVEIESDGDHTVDSEETADTSEEDEHEVVYETVDKSVVLYVGDLNENHVYYVRMDGSSEIRGIPQTTLGTYMNAKVFDYWSLTVDSINISDLKYLEVTYDGKTYELQRVTEEVVKKTENKNGEMEEETEMITTYYVNEVEVDSTVFLDFFRNAGNVECQNRLKEPQKIRNPQLELKYYGVDGSVVHIKYGERDGNFYNVTDQDGNSGIVNKMKVKELINQLITLINEIE